MATYTTNYNLEKPDSTDDFGDFRASYNDNMDIIDQNLGGGGGGGHTILDENDQTMTQRTGLQFTGNVEVTDDSVNDKTVVDMPYEVVHLTQAQYDALPNTKLTDGKIYCITDVYSGGSDKLIGLGDCYSTTEKVVGCWTDGKPLYKRTWVFTSDLSCNSNEWTNTPIDKGDIENIVYAEAINDVGNYWGIVSTAISSNQYIQVLNSRNRAITIRQITLRYTKTTDTAGSGDWTPSGVPAVHYDGNEKVIGTWFGETLYEKTFHLSNKSISVGKNIIVSTSDLSSLTIDKVIGTVDGCITLSGGTYIINVPYGIGATSYVTADYDSAEGIRVWRGGSAFTANDIYLTIQYTKTS